MFSLLCCFLCDSFKNSRCIFARTARELAEDMIRICDSHMEQAWYDAPQPSSSTAVPQAASTQTVSKKRAWADVECNETPENLGMVEQSAAVGGGERPLGNLNVFQTYICRKILCDEPFLLAKGQFILDEHGDPLDPEEREEHIVVSVANVPGSIEDAVEGVVIARKCCQHYVGRNLYLLEKRTRRTNVCLCQRNLQLLSRKVKSGRIARRLKRRR